MIIPSLLWDAMNLWKKYTRVRILLIGPADQPIKKVKDITATLCNFFYRKYDRGKQ